MKALPNIQIYQTLFEQTFNTEQTIHSCYSALSSIYRRLQAEYPFFKPFPLKTVYSDSLLYQVYYEKPIGISEKSIVIQYFGENAYLWKDAGGWCLDDSYYGTKEIVDVLLQEPVLRYFPENVKEIKWLLDKAYWQNTPVNFPVWGTPPNETDEVLSWDEDFVLVGRSQGNVFLLEREEWKQLCYKENHWFQEFNN